jgi:cell division protein FtsI/penicillin-binding protein 2
VQAAGLGALGLRFFNLQVVQEGRYAPLAEENRINLQVLAPKRGRILDRNGVELAGNDEVFRAILIPALTADVRASLVAFRRIVPLPLEEAEKIARRAKSQNRNIAIPLARDLSFEQVCVRAAVAWHSHRSELAAALATGGVVVMASTPGYDPAEVADGLSADAWNRIAGSAEHPMTNRAPSGQYPLGSTFKMVTALAAL